MGGILTLLFASVLETIGNVPFEFAFALVPSVGAPITDPAEMRGQYMLISLLAVVKRLRAVETFEAVVLPVPLQCCGTLVQLVTLLTIISPVSSFKMFQL